MSSDIPVRTSRVRYAESYLYDDFNDVDFFIEDKDENTKKIILKLLQRAFSDEIKITQVFPLGGRDKVIEQYEQRDTSRKQVYIIDGDLYLLFENEQTRNGLVVLNKYCIENYLFDEQAIHELLYDECCKESDYNSMCRLFGFQTWWESQIKYLYRMFIEYAIEKKNHIGLTTVKYNVHRLLDTNDDKVNKYYVTERIKNLRAEIKNNITREQYNTSRVEIISNINYRHTDKANYISGKDYILPILFKKIKQYSNSNLADINFKYRLAKTCDILEIKELIQIHL